MGPLDARGSTLSAIVPIGRRLRDLRRAQGWTLRDVELRTDGRFSVGSLGSYERGTRMMTADRFVDLCEVYGADPEQVLGAASDGPAPDVVVLDVERVLASDELDLARLCRSVLEMRREAPEHGGVELRRLDLDRLAAARGVSREALVWQLRSSGLALPSSEDAT